MAIISVPKVPGSGYSHVRVARNESIPDGFGLSVLAGQANMILGRRKKVLWSHANIGTDPRAIHTATGIVYAGRFYTSPNPRAVKVRMLVIDSTAAGADPYLQWTVGGVAQPAISIAAGPAAPTATPSGLRVIDRTFIDGSGNDLAGATAYDFKVEATDGASICGATIYEVVNAEFDTTYHTCVPTDVYAVGAKILDRDITALIEKIWTAYKQQGTHHVRWSNEDTSPRARNSATYENVIDGATTGYAATAAGFPYYPYRRGRQTTTTVPCVFWAYASTNAGSTGRVRFTDGGGTLATITGIGTTLQVYTTTGTIDSTQTRRLCVIEHSDSTPNTITTRAAGFYELTT